MSSDLLDGDFQALPARSIAEATCRKFTYKIGMDQSGRKVQIADYRNAAGETIAQKVRYADKTFKVLGAGGNGMPLFGQNLWASGGKRLIVTEGEIDAMSIAQVFGLTWPVVSVPNGAAGALRAIKNSIEFVESFEAVVFCFDQDDPGRAAAAECAAALTPGKAFIAELPMKDANDLLKAGKIKEITTACWQARPYRPDGIVSLSDIRDRVLLPVKDGLPWCFNGITRATHGRYIGDIIGIGAGVGAGKTDFLTQQIEYDVNTLGLRVGVLSLEQDVGDTGRRLAGKAVGKRFHVAGAGWGTDELVEAWGALEATGRVFLYDNCGAIDWPTIEAKIRFLIESLDCSSIYLDHLTALIAGEADERRALDKIMASLAMIAKGRCIIHFVSHLTTPDGTAHEEGGRVMAKHFTGSRAIMRWAHLLVGLERNQQAEDETERSTSVLRMLKERLSGDSAGKTWRLLYDRETGRMREDDGVNFGGVDNEF